MKFSKKILAVLALLPGFVFANEGGFPLDRAPERNDIVLCKTAPSCSSTTA
jgi:ubiquinol-cytochrome c reductase cytochrome c1 subunit